MASFIPLSLEPSSTFNIRLEDGVFDLRVYYSTTGMTWGLDIAKDGVTLVDGLTLVLGVDLMRPFNFGIGFWAMVDLSGQDLDATRTDLGIDVILLYIPEAERGDV